MEKKKFSELDYDGKKLIIQEVSIRAELSRRINGNYLFHSDGAYYRYLISLREYINNTLPLLKLKDYFEYHYISQKNGIMYVDTESINDQFNDIIRQLFMYSFKRMLDKYSIKMVEMELSISNEDKRTVIILTGNNDAYKVITEHIDELKERIINELSSFSCIFDFLIKYIEIIDCKVYLGTTIDGKKRG